MAILVPLILGGLALAVMTIVSMLANRKKRKGKQQDVGQVRILIHAINDDRCTGCDACVAVCPTNVLDLISNKSRVLRFQDCIQCEACMWACPTEALVMFPEGTQPPPIRTPNIDANFQTAVPGQYLIGEVAGKPLVKNAANLGRAVVEHMLHEGLRAFPPAQNSVDVIIVGSGPGGMSAALSCRQRGLSYLVIEKENIISSTVSRYPKGKSVMAEPYETANLSLLPVYDSQKEEMIAVWQELAQKVDLQIRMHETVQIIHKQQDGSFLTNTTAAQYRSQRVILATGTRGKPRTLGVPGEHYPKIESLLEDPDHFRGKMVCVIGGGDSALEAALALAEAEARVILSYRGRSFHRAQAKNRQSIDRMSQQGRMKVKLQSEVVDFGEDTVTLQMSDGTQKRYPNQAAFVLIGADPPIQWLSTLGIHYVERAHMAAMPASDELVRMLVPQAQECPTNAQDAAGLVFGQQITPSAHAPSPQQRQQKDARSKSSVSIAGRKFMKSASSLFGIGNDKRPIPLSEFAQRGQSERAEPRDQLDASERTRILRMLRDEGGRHADEESQLYNVSGFQERAEQEQQEQRWESPTTAASPPKEALIVGLAKVSREAPRGRQMRPVVEPHHETPKYEQPQQQYEQPQQQYEEAHFQNPFDEEEKTAHLSPEEAQHLVNSSVHIPEAPSRILGGEEATQFAEFSPHESTQPTPAQAHGLYEDDEATLLADVSSLLKEDFTPEPEKLSYEESTRVASDLDYQPRSLSQVDWDLD